MFNAAHCVTKNYTTKNSITKNWIMKTSAIICLFTTSYYGQSTEQNHTNNTQLNEYVAHYQVYREGSNYGNAIRTLSKNENSLYTLRLKTNTSVYFYSIDTEESSQFSYEKNHIKPIKYMGKDKRSLKKTKHVEMVFDYTKGVVQGENTTTPWSLPLAPSTFDPLLVIEKMSQDLKNKVQKPTYNVYDEQSVKTYLFEYAGIEKIVTSMGEIDAFKVTRIRNNSTRKTHFWLSIRHGFIPFKVKQENDGKEIATLEITSLNTGKANE